MWYLTSDNDNRIMYVLPNKDITIGRSVDAQVCNFAITEDQSISRKHATLTVQNNDLILEDMGSRYNTFVNNVAVKANTKVKVNHNDVVKFGKMNSIWTVLYVNFTTCTSTLKGENLNNLKLMLGKLGAVLKNEWDDSCTYLTMPAITLTIKVVLALVQGSFIVTPEYWAKCLEAVNNYAALPNPSYYTPQVIESTLNKENVSFLPNEDRKNIFAGKKVVFFSKRQMEMYKQVLLKCASTPVLLSDTMMTKSALSEDNVIVIQYTTTSQDAQSQQSQINDIINYLKSKGKRAIADAEIGLSVLYCSIVRYCNPLFNFSTEVLKQAPEQPKTTTVLAQESQEPTSGIKKDNVIINESLSSSFAKRKLSDEDIEMNASKKMATGHPSTTLNTEAVKRKMIDDSSTANPSKKVALDDEDSSMFNFTSNSKRDANKSVENNFNFMKPQKRKANNASNEDEDLFNFDQNNKSNNTSSNSKRANVEEEFGMDSVAAPKKVVEEKIDLTAMRGSKLLELMEHNSKMSSENIIPPNLVIKKEDPDDIDKKVLNLDIGAIVITIKKDLIKKEPNLTSSNISTNQTYNGEVKNFKKFRKVWPLNKSGNSFPKTTSMNIAIADSMKSEEINSMSY